MKKIVLILAVCFIQLSVIAQNKFSFLYGFGIMTAPIQTRTINQITAFNDTTIIKFDIQALSYSTWFYPKYHFTDVEEVSKSKTKSKRKSDADTKPYDFSVGMPIMIGFGGSSNGTFGIDYNLALCGDINFGNCTLEKESMIGGYVGLGFGIAKTNNLNIITSSAIDNGNYSGKNKTVKDLNNYRGLGFAYGPILHAGVKFGEDRPFGINLAYQPAINKSGLNYYTIALQIPFGNNMGYF